MLATDNKCKYCQGNEPLVSFDDTPIQIYMGFNEDSALSVDVTSASEQMLLFKVNGRYVLPHKNDLVKYKGNGKWEMGWSDES